jgi:hypothetical protein
MSIAVFEHPPPVVVPWIHLSFPFQMSNNVSARGLHSSVLENISFDQLRDNRRDGELEIPLLPEYIRTDRHILPLDRELYRQWPNLHDLAYVQADWKCYLVAILTRVQFTSMLGDVPTDQPAAGKYAKKY